jgi:hypothetical protein
MAWAYREAGNRQQDKRLRGKRNFIDTPDIKVEQRRLEDSNMSISYLETMPAMVIAQLIVIFFGIHA